MELTFQEIAIRLVVATVLCGIIGIEREVKHKPAGVRTNALIGLGAAVATLCGVFIAASASNTTDPSRIASIVIQGIGFLGAGVIIQASGSVHGLTTAATMWVVAGIGIAAGFGFYSIAIIATVLVLILLAIFGPLDARLMGNENGNGKKGMFGGLISKQKE